MTDLFNLAQALQAELQERGPVVRWHCRATIDARPAAAANSAIEVTADLAIHGVDYHARRRFDPVWVENDSTRAVIPSMLLEAIFSQLIRD